MSDKRGRIAIILSVVAIMLSVVTLVLVCRPADNTTTESDDQDIQYVMYLGTNDKDTNMPVYPPEEAQKIAQKVLIDHFGGYTIQEAHGGWIDGDKEYQEYTLVIYLSDTDIEQVHSAADELVDLFHQSSVLIQANKTTTEFYAGKNN